jgi:hypothetical protein
MRPHLETLTCLTENKYLFYRSRRDLKPRMTVLARTSRNLTDRQIRVRYRDYTSLPRKLALIHLLPVLQRILNLGSSLTQQQRLFLVHKTTPCKEMNEFQLHAVSHFISMSQRFCFLQPSVSVLLRDDAVNISHCKVVPACDNVGVTIRDATVVAMEHPQFTSER